MDIDTDWIDDGVLALMWLGFHDGARVEVFRLGRDGPAAHVGIGESHA
jgi:hypothetical protein